MAALIWPNTEKFNTSVRDGSLDYTLLQPANSMFLVTFSRMVIWRVWDLVLAAVLIVIGIRHERRAAPRPSTWSASCSWRSPGTLILYSLWIVLIAATFWFIKFDNNVTILQALLDTGRYPATVYPAWLRMIVTFIVPIAVATTVPLQALRGDLTGWQVLLFLGDRRGQLPGRFAGLEGRGQEIFRRQQFKPSHLPRSAISVGMCEGSLLRQARTDPSHEAPKGTWRFGSG